MAERSRLWTTNNTGDGPSAGYTAADWEKLIRHWLQAGDEANGGVLLGIGSNLAVSGTASPVSVAAGAAIVYGRYYENDAALTLAVTTPVVGTTGGHIILRASWAAQTIRLVAVRNTDGVNATPALTQSAGTTWEIRLATFTITTGGVITLTDARKFAKYSARVYGDQLDPSIVDAATLEIAANVLRVRDLGVTAAKLATDAVTTAKILDANVTTVKIADDAVTDAKVGARVPYLHRRRGGDPSDWSVGGTTDYTPSGPIRMQSGVVSLPGGAGTVGLTFPVAYSQKPIVLLSLVNNGSGGEVYVVGASFTTSGFNIGYSGIGTGTCHWLALGPE